MVQKQAGSKLQSARQQVSPHGDVRNVTGQQSKEESGERKHGKALAGLSSTRKNPKALKCRAKSYTGLLTYSSVWAANVPNSGRVLMFKKVTFDTQPLAGFYNSHSSQTSQYFKNKEENNGCYRVKFSFHPLLTVQCLEDQYIHSSRKQSKGLHVSHNTGTTLLQQKPVDSHSFVVACFLVQGILSHSTQAIQSSHGNKA